MMESESYRKQCYEQAVEKLKNEYHDRNPIVDASYSVRRVSERMATYSAVLLSEIADKLSINSLGLLEYASVDYEWSEEILRDAFQLADALSAYCGHNNDDHMMVNAQLRALRHYEGLCAQQSDGYPERRLKQAEAIVKVTQHLESRVDIWVYFDNDHGSRPYISDASLRALLLDSDTDLETVVHLIQERNVLDADALREIVQAVTEPSLTSGAL